MNRIAAIAALILLMCHSGCSLCCTPWDYAYAGYGGRVPREDRFYGRVGSAFDPAGAMPGVMHPRDYVPPTNESEEVAPPAPEQMEESAPDESTATSFE